MLALLILFTLPAHAEVRLSASELDAKNLRICQSLQSVIEDSSRISDHYSILSDASAESAYQKLQADVTAEFKSLECEKRLEAKAAADEALAKECYVLRQQAAKISDRLDDLALKGLQTLKPQRGQDELYAQLEKIQRDAKRLGCHK